MTVDGLAAALCKHMHVWYGLLCRDQAHSSFCVCDWANCFLYIVSFMVNLNESTQRTSYMTMKYCLFGPKKVRVKKTHMYTLMHFTHGAEILVEVLKRHFGL